MTVLGRSCAHHPAAVTASGDLGAGQLAGRQRACAGIYDGVVIETVDVALSASGQPMRVTRGGRVWNVCALPVRWFERVPWWRFELRMQRGAGIGVEVMVWQVQVRLGSSPRSELVTWELVNDPATGRWTVREETLGRASA